MSLASISYPHPQQSAQEARIVSSWQQQSRTDRRSANINSMATCYTYELSNQQQQQLPQKVPQQKDYSRPLHVDCSVEYELPNQAKPPAGVRNEPLLMIHPCYFRKIESQRRSPFINNLPATSRQVPQVPQVAVAAAATAVAAKRRLVARGQQLPQQVPQQAAPYPVHYATDKQQQQQWEPSLVPLPNVPHGGAGHWPDPLERSPDRPDVDKHILTGKYRQYLRAHRLHPYVASAIPLASTFPQIQQVCYNV